MRYTNLGVRRKQHDTDAARPRTAAAPVRILQPCGRAGGGAAQSAGVPAPGKPAHALPRAAATRAVRAACAAGCHRARGHARRRCAAGRAPAGGERDGRRRGRAPRRRAPGASRDAAAAPARGARAGAPARARSATFNLERADEGFKLLKFAHKKSKFEIQNPMLTLGLLIDSKNLFIGQYDKLFEEYWLSPISYLSPYRG